jgi:hypothetical protein
MSYIIPFHGRERLRGAILGERGSVGQGVRLIVEMSSWNFVVMLIFGDRTTIGFQRFELLFAATEGGR